MTLAMRTLAANSELRQKLAHEGRIAVERKYNRENYAKRYIELVEEVVSKTR